MHANEFASINIACQHTVDNYVFDFKDLQKDGGDYVVQDAAGTN